MPEIMARVEVVTSTPGSERTGRTPETASPSGWLTARSIEPSTTRTPSVHPHAEEPARDSGSRWMRSGRRASSPPPLGGSSTSHTGKERPRDRREPSCPSGGEPLMPRRIATGIVNDLALSSRRSSSRPGAASRRRTLQASTGRARGCAWALRVRRGCDRFVVNRLGPEVEPPAPAARANGRQVW
jgi:hypothetical protein